MQDIELDELFKSNEFIKHVKIADGLTNETGFEHGFTFCKLVDEIIIDKMCVGDECSIGITSEICPIHTNTFHIHPKGVFSDFSFPDVALTLGTAYQTKGPIIECVKSIDSEFIHCEKIHKPTNKESMNRLLDIARMFNTHEISEDDALDFVYKTFDISDTEFSVIDGHKQTYAEMIKKTLSE